MTFHRVPPVDPRASGRSRFTTSSISSRRTRSTAISLGTKSKGFRFEADGSLIIHVQKDKPDADKVSNWLPAPDDEFSLYIRAYWPLEPLNEGGWTPPPVVPRSSAAPARATLPQIARKRGHQGLSKRRKRAPDA